ncbi:MAG TPA: hypothetical protein VJQ77_02220 [Novosphingobium sp.]|nr:hypothetical protein [Novosphingobium sp.]
MQREEIIRIAGTIDDESVTAIEAMDATPAELMEAMNWLANDEALVSEGRHMPAGRIARLVDILEAPEQEIDPLDH